ncbi:hypothetical protein LI90_1534 [Carbonactinospora thermoautotrophica]|uniref:Uncharacterized protein n=1 Tax=Carbonactinospora thermoautotrophica TaxID=1469144 RepID=A0A132MPV2_9ACTN|nr:hypothetical protein LI90_1534 [Carbonactinospora thermoautotrophica]
MIPPSRGGRRLLASPVRVAGAGAGRDPGPSRRELRRVPAVSPVPAAGEDQPQPGDRRAPPFRACACPAPGSRVASPSRTAGSVIP